MASAHLRAQIEDLRRRIETRLARPTPFLEKLRADPTALLRCVSKTPDPWQERLLRSTSTRILLACGRQMGKTEVSASVTLRTALLRPSSLVLILSPSERQSGEFAQRVFHLYDAAGRPVAQIKRTELQLTLANGSRIIALPDSERTIRGFAGVRMLVIDEASRVSDDLYLAVRPMLAVSGGKLIALSTPYGKRGFFWEAWQGKTDSKAPDRWERYRVTADQCPRYTAEYLAEERREMGDRAFRQEFMVEFNETLGAVFAQHDIDRALSIGREYQPLALE